MPNAMNSNFYCCKCGQKGIPIARLKGRERKAGHLKKIYCLHCGKEINHVECKPFSKYDYKDFIFERGANNFNENGERKVPYGILKNNINETINRVWEE